MRRKRMSDVHLASSCITRHSWPWWRRRGIYFGEHKRDGDKASLSAELSSLCAALVTLVLWPCFAMLSMIFGGL